MRKIRLLKLKIKNFRCFDDLELNFDGKSKVLAGTNEAGKTATADAYSWLISDKDSKGNGNPVIKPYDRENSNEEFKHHLNTIVEGTFQILKDGSFEKEFTLKKDYYEKWTRKRGTTTEEFSGHTTDYYIDDVPEKKSDYEDFIDNIIDYETLKLISDPLYFSEQLHWKEQREIIYNMADRPDPGEVAAKCEKYYLAEKLEDTTTEKHQKKLKAKMKKINKKLDKIPARIDEVQKSISGMEITADKSELQKELKQLNERLEELQEEKAELKNDSQSSVMKEIINLKAELQTKKEELLEKANNRFEQYREEKRKLESAKDNYEVRIQNLNNTIELQEKRKKEADNRRQELLNKYHEVDKREFDEEAKTCDKCGQKLPEDQIEEIKQQFNKKKSNKLADIKSKGQKQAKIKEEADENIEKALAGVEKYNNKIDELDFERVDTGLEKGKEYKEKIKNNELDELKDIAQEIEELEDTKPDSEPVDLKDINAEISDIKKDSKAIEKQLSNIENMEKAKARVEELQEEEQKLVDNYEQFEKELYDLEAYIKTEIEMMEEDINNKFKVAEFKMFEKQVNGAINETCEAMKNGVPYGELNTGSQYQVGMDIINTLSEHYGIAAPVFVDNRERIASLPEVDSQTIQLVMTPDRDKLEMINMADEDEAAEFVSEEAGVKRESLF